MSCFCIPFLKDCKLASEIPDCKHRNPCIGKMVGYGLLTALALTVALVAFHRGMNSVMSAVHSEGWNTAKYILLAKFSFVVTGASGFGALYCFQRTKQHFDHMPAAPAIASSRARNISPNSNGGGHRLGNGSGSNP